MTCNEHKHLYLSAAWFNLTHFSSLSESLLLFSYFSKLNIFDVGLSSPRL